MAKTIDQPLKKGVPGKILVFIQMFKDGDPKYRTPSGENEGISLTELKSLFGGKEDGFVYDPFHGLAHSVSIKPWSKEDPQKTFLSIIFRFIEDKKS